MEYMNSPCEKCIKVEKPAECANFHCPMWREWFVRAWNKTRIAVLLKVQGIKEEQ